jgi:hypothetical protein
MDRERLLRMTLDELVQLAGERGIEGAERLSREALVERLAPGRRAAERPRETAGEATRRPGGQPPEPARAREPARPRFDVPSSTVHPHAEELETLVMARLYVAEGALDRALEIYEKLVALDPDDAALCEELALLVRRSPPRPVEPPSTPPPSGHREPLGMLDYEELPETYGVDECEVLYKDPHWLFAYWEVTEGGMQAARAQLGPSGGAARLVLRLFTTASHAAAGDVEREIRDIELPHSHGRRYLPATRPGAHLRIAVGLLTPEGYFAPIAHSSLVRVPPAEPAPPGPVEWMEVVPSRTRGRDREPLVIVRRGAGHTERGIGAARAASPVGVPTSPGRPLGGSSATWKPGDPKVK